MHAQEDHAVTGLERIDLVNALAIDGVAPHQKCA